MATPRAAHLKADIGAAAANSLFVPQSGPWSQELRYNN